MASFHILGTLHLWMMMHMPRWS